MAFDALRRDPMCRDAVATHCDAIWEKRRREAMRCHSIRGHAVALPYDQDKVKECNGAGHTANFGSARRRGWKEGKKQITLRQRT